MPNANVHRPIGMVAGAAAAWKLSGDQQLEDRVLRTVAGALGGYHGARLPDELEPATSPNHRALAHSALVLFGGGGTALAKGREGIAWANERVQELERRLVAETVPWKRLLLAVAILIGQAIIGYIIGLGAGYASHLLLDAPSARSLPLLGLTATGAS